MGYFLKDAAHRIIERDVECFYQSPTEPRYVLPSYQRSVLETVNAFVEFVYTYENNGCVGMFAPSL